MRKNATRLRLAVIALATGLTGAVMAGAPAQAAVDDQALLEAARTYFTGENTIRVGDDAAGDATTRARKLAVTAGFAQVRDDRMAARQQEAQLGTLSGVRFSGVTTDVAQVGPAREQGDTARLTVREHTAYTYATGSADPYSYTVRHELTFTHEGATWRLASISTDDGPAHLATPRKLTAGQLSAAERTVKDLKAALSRVPDAGRGDPAAKQQQSGPGVRTQASYNYRAMADFAKKYAKAGNNVPYERDTNDCTNFVSQALSAGGWQRVTGWYRSDSAWWYNHNPWPFPDNHSYTWGGAPNWQRFARDKSHRVYELPGASSLAIADVVQFSIRGYSKPGEPGHTMMVTDFTADWQPLMSYHTTDTLNKPLSDIIAGHQGEKFWYFRT